MPKYDGPRHISDAPFSTQKAETSIGSSGAVFTSLPENFEQAAVSTSGVTELDAGSLAPDVFKAGINVASDGSLFVGPPKDALVTNVHVAAGGFLDVESGGTVIGGDVAGLALVESGGTLAEITFNGTPKGGRSGVNGYVDKGGQANSNIVESGAVVDFNGGTGTDNIVKEGGTIDAGRGTYWEESPSSGHGGGQSQSQSMGPGGSTQVQSGGDQSSQSTDNGSQGQGQSGDAGSQSQGQQGGGDQSQWQGGGASNHPVYGGTVISTHVESGGLLNVSGGLASDTEITSGGVVDVGSWEGDSPATGNGGHQGQSQSQSQNGGGHQGQSQSQSQDGGGQQNQNQGQSQDGGGQQSQSQGQSQDGGISHHSVYGGTVISTNVGSGGFLNVSSGGVASQTIINSNATMFVHSGAVVAGATVGAGEDFGANGTITKDPELGKVIVSSGGDFEGGTLLGGGQLTNNGVEMGGLLRVEAGATVTDLQMGAYGQIEVMGVNYAAGESVTYQGGKITLMSNGHPTWSASLAGQYTSSDFQVWDDNGTAVIVYICFLKGTHISTPNGEIEVQHLKAGDFVWAREGGKDVPRLIKEIRHHRSEVNPNLPIDLAGWSVCIKKDAFGANLPERDLRVTSEHCFYFEGRFIPIRMLVNGASIYYDTSLEVFEFFHLETEPHSIIRAEGVLTESWLNTQASRRAVYLPNGLTSLEVIPPRSWERDAAAPLDVSASFAQHLWQKFNHRALKRNMDYQVSHQWEFDNNPDLHLRLENGRKIQPRNRRGNKYFFQLPANIGTDKIFLCSKTFRPSESVGPWVDDRRELGVLVGKINLAIGDSFKEIRAYYNVANALGWDVVENTPCRWTKGAALLPVLGTEEELRAGFSLIVDVLAGGPYLVSQEREKKEKSHDIAL
ncbi:outer membrane protein [Lasius niger]|uniref:Outer membrane protein n=1 Tax=Lasius niger TaxID=67767 RepID=A0A0J7L096_LASNI|nr:outer membrane protein [Lasius niger]